MSVNLLIEEAECFEKQNLWQEALKKYHEFYSITTDSKIIEKISFCLSRLGDYDESLKWLLKVNETSPNDKKNLYMIGYQYYCKKDWKKAVFYFEQSLAQFKEYFVVKYRLSYALLQIAGDHLKLTKAEFWKAISHLDECHKIWNNYNDIQKSKNKSVYFDINFLHGKALMDIPNKLKEAIIFFNEALKIRSDSDCSYNLSKTYYLMEDFKKAEEVLIVNNKYYTIELDAFINLKLGNFDNAINKVNALLKSRKKDYLYAFMAEVYIQKKDFVMAYDYSKKAISSGNDNHKNYFVHAKSLFNLGLYNESIKNIEIAKSKKTLRFGGFYGDAEELQKLINSRIYDGYSDDLKLLDSLNKNKEVSIGIVSKYNDEKGFGFIKYENESLFFHIKNCDFKKVEIGARVKFDVITSEKGKSAINVSTKNNT